MLLYPDIIIISSHSERRLKKILEYNATLPETEKIAGIIFTCTKVGIRLRESIKDIVEHRVPGLYVPEDTSTADEKLYKCIKNTKLQAYDSHKHAQIEQLFSDHFNVEQFIECFKIEK